MEKRRIEKEIPREVTENGCLLCSEDKPHHCNRRVVAEYFKRHWDDVDISHLLRIQSGADAPPVGSLLSATAPKPGQ